MNYDKERVRKTGSERIAYDDEAKESSYARRRTAPVYENRAHSGQAPANQRSTDDTRRIMSYDEYMAQQNRSGAGYRGAQLDYDDESESRGSRPARSRTAGGYTRTNAEYSCSGSARRYGADDYDFDNPPRARSGGTRRTSSAHGYPRSRRSNNHAGRNVVLALLAMSLLVIIPLSIKGGLFGGSAPDSFMNGMLGTVPTAETPFEDVFATATPQPTLAAAVPTAIPTPAPTEEPTAVSGRVLDPNKKAIAITFDDGPSKYTREILATLAKVDGRATFFVVGNRLDNFSETLQMEYDADNQIGMHTYNHENLTKLSESKIRKEISRTNDLIYQYLGEHSTIVRPPYGSVNSKVKETVEEPLINWSLDTRDWESRNADSVYNEIMNNVQDGDIILMHDLYASTAEAVSRVVPELVEQGYQLCTVEELFELKGIELHNGTVFRSARKTSDG